MFRANSSYENWSHFSPQTGSFFFFQAEACFPRSLIVFKPNQPLLPFSGKREDSDVRAALIGASAALNVTLVCLPVFAKRGPNGGNRTRREEEQNLPQCHHRPGLWAQSWRRRRWERCCFPQPTRQQDERLKTDGDDDEDDDGKKRAQMLMKERGLPVRTACPICQRAAGINTPSVFFQNLLFAASHTAFPTLHPTFPMRREMNGGIHPPSLSPRSGV